MACDAEQAKSLCCILPGLHPGVQSYLLARIRGGSMDVNEIVRQAACEFGCIPPNVLGRIRSYLLCQLSNTGGGSVPVPVCDSDAEVFITTAGITVQAQQDAICRFVARLKNNGTPPFWDSEILLYPFVGGTGPQHSYNLANPATYQLTYHGVPPPTHNANGMLGNAATAYANTHYIPRTGPPAVNTLNMRVYVYFNTLDLAASRYSFAARSNAAANRLEVARLDATRSLFSLNESATAFLYTGNGDGGYIMQTADGTVRRVAYNGLALAVQAYTRSNSPINEMLILAINNNGVFPAVIPSNFSAAQISGISIGSRALTDAEWPIYHSIWQDFQAELGRRKP